MVIGYGICVDLIPSVQKLRIFGRFSSRVQPKICVKLVIDYRNSIYPINYELVSTINILERNQLYMKGKALNKCSP